MDVFGLKKILGSWGVSRSLASDMTYAIYGLMGFLILLMVWMLFRWIRKVSRLRRLQKELTPFYDKVTVKKAIKNYTPVRSLKSWDAQAKNRQAGEILPTLFLKGLLDPMKEDGKFFVVLGESGMGKTTFLINLYQSYKRKRKESMLDIALIDLRHPDAFTHIRNIENKSHTILLLDSLELLPIKKLDYRQKVDSVLDQVGIFPKVVITCRPYFFPAAMEDATSEAPIRFVGERHNEVFEKHFIVPFEKEDIHQFIHKKYSFFASQKRNHAKYLVDKLPYVLKSPVFLNYIDVLMKRREPFTYTYQIYEEIISQWVESLVKDMSSAKPKQFRLNVWSLLQRLAYDIYIYGNERGYWGIEEADVKFFARKCDISLSYLALNRSGIMHQHPNGYYQFSHSGLWSYLVAKQAWTKPDFEEEYDFQFIREAETFFYELCWEHYLKSFEFGQMREFYRTNLDSNELLLKNASFKVLRNITRLYIYDFQGKDLRFLKYMPKLEGIYLMGGELEDLSHYLLAQLTDFKGFVYFTRMDKVTGDPQVVECIKLINLDQLPREEGENWSAFNHIDLWERPLIHAKLLAKAGAEDGKDFFTLFDLDLKGLPDSQSNVYDDPRMGHRSDVQVYERVLNGRLFELFDKILIYVFSDGRINLRFMNTYKPIFLLQDVQNMVNALFECYGEDDEGRGAFSTDDQSQLKDGFWMGRSWRDTERFAYPLTLWMEERDRVKFVVYGLQSQAVVVE